MKLPLFGLLADTVLPGEERSVGAPALDASQRRALAELVGQRCVLLTITTPLELPGMVASRYGTEVEVLRVAGESLVVRGHRRVKVVKALNQAAPFEAEVNAEKEEPQDEQALALAVGRLGEALASGGVAEGGAARLEDAAATLLRAVTPVSELPRLTRVPLVDALDQANGLVRARARVFAAAEKLEKALSTIAPRHAATPEQRRRLWSQVVEVEKALDVYDPNVDTDANDLARLEKRLRQAGLPGPAKEMAKRELRLLRNMESRNSEMTTYLTHLELMARLAWHPAELPPVDLAKVQAVLDRDHAGMEKVKQRVLEHLAVRALGGSAKSTVLCLVGPPGTGKTTIARAMAEALGRPFVRIALGGVHDQAELRGHRRTYSGAAEGRVIQAMANAGSMTPLVLLDELDKLGTDRSRNATGALLELLDPEQHTHFMDHFLGTPYDLSHVLFVCTANDPNRIDPILRDRLEQVELDGYSLEEKLGLARTHLLPRVVKETAIGAAPELSDELLLAIIEGHTREAGLRQLKQKLSALLRSRALSKVRDGADPSLPVTREELDRVLGRGRQPRREREDSLPPGTAMGLSVSGDGGALLPVEVVRLKGKGKLHLTGRLGEVLKESAQAVLAHLRHARERYGIDEEAFQSDLHVHLPDGATPKDGPSAGITLAVAMTSALTGRPVHPDVAFTGELTLGGRVTAVGGVRAKVLAAERAGMTRVVVPSENRPDLPEATKLTPVLVDRLEQVMEAAFGPLAPESHEGDEAVLQDTAENRQAG